MKTSISPAILIAGLVMFALSSCMPQREFVQFGNPGTFHPGPRHSEGHSGNPAGEYDSYELVDHGGIPNHGIPPMYSGQQDSYPAAVPGYDAYGNPVTVIVPNPW